MLVELGGMDIDARSFIERILRREPSAMQMIKNLTVDRKAHNVVELTTDKQDETM